MGETHDRERWEGHPNIGGLAGMLLGIHDQFRSATRKIRAEVDGTGSLERARRSYAWLASTLHHHHRLEEAMLFPTIGRKSGRFPDELVGDHETLSTAIDQATEALEGDVRESAQEALAALDRCLEDHLQAEESLVIPILLEMPEAEMHALLGGL